MELQEKIRHCMGSAKIIVKNNIPYVVNQNKDPVGESDFTLREWVELYNSTSPDKISQKEIDLANFEDYILSR